MRGTAELQAMKQHPATGVKVEERSPAAAFLAAVDDYLFAKDLFGPASQEADDARLEVAMARQRALTAWKQAHEASWQGSSAA